MAGPELRRDVAIVLGALILVLDHQGNRGAGGQALEHPGLDLDDIRLAPLGGEARLAGLALVQEVLDVRLGQRQARRDTIDDGADRGSVAFAPGGESERRAEAVARHDVSPWPRCR